MTIEETNGRLRARVERPLRLVHDAMRDANFAAEKLASIRNFLSSAEETTRYPAMTELVLRLTHSSAEIASGCAEMAELLTEANELRENGQSRLINTERLKTTGERHRQKFLLRESEALEEKALQVLHPSQPENATDLACRSAVDAFIRASTGLSKLNVLTGHMCTAANNDREATLPGPSH